MSEIPQHRLAVAKTIRKYRLKADWSQEKLAEMADLHPVHISNLEHGKKNISLDTLVKVADALGVQLSQLVRNVQPKEKND